MLKTSNMKSYLSNKPIIIKPNLIDSNTSSNGVTTDPKVVEAIVIYLQKNGFKDIIIAEGSGFGDTMDNFKKLGFSDIAEKYGISLLDLNKGPFKEFSLFQIKIGIRQEVLEHQIISVPKLKPHSTFDLTASIKNMMGCVMPKGHLHHAFYENILNLFEIVKPIYGVIDAFVSNGLEERIPRPLRLNAVLCSNDPLALDIVCGKIIGREYVGYLMNAEKRYGKREIEIEGNLEELKELYRNGGIKG